MARRRLEVIVGIYHKKLIRFLTARDPYAYAKIRVIMLNVALSQKKQLTGGVTMQTEEVIQKADEVIDLNYLKEPPVDVYSLAKNYGLQIIQQPFPAKYQNISGFIS